MRFRRPALSPSQRRLERAITIEDLRRVSRRRVPRSVFDYVDGAAERELSLARCRTLFDSLEFVPSVLRDVSDVDTTTVVLDRRSAQPFLFAPTGFTRLMNHEGEAAVARVAERRGIPYVLSTMGTTAIEDVVAAAPSGRNWFQLYVWRDRDATEQLVARAAAAGMEALVLTVDVPVAGARQRDQRNGFTIPPTLTVRTVLDAARRPACCANLLTTAPLEFASLQSWQGTIAELIDTLFDPTMTIDDLRWLRSVWDGPIVVKGIQSVDDARRMVDAGVEAIVLSNHGGRQLDRATPPLMLVADVRAAVGSAIEIYTDGGTMSGGDVVAAIAAGADAVLVGRAYLYGLMAGGERGVSRATEILEAEVARTMQLLGASTIGELNPDHVRLPRR